MQWVDEPATEQQLIHLRELGFKIASPLMRTEAARLIRDLRRNPARASDPTAALNPPRFLDRRPPPAAAPAPALPPGSLGHGLSDSVRTEAYRLRLAAQQSQKALTANASAPNVRADAVATLTSRREFWLDTCREVKEMRIGSMHVFELYQKYGCRFFLPSQQQIQELLDALDAAMPLWDRDHPELLFQTLELNFPQLVKHG